MDDRISFQLKSQGVGYGGLSPVFTTPQLLLDALKALDVEIEDYANTQAQVIADQCFGSEAEVRWSYHDGGGHYFYPRCPSCRKTRNWCTCPEASPAPEDLSERISNYEMTYGPKQLNKSIYLAGVIFSYHGYHYILYPSKLKDPALDNCLYAVIFKDREVVPLELTPNFDSAWETHKAAEIMINDLTKGEPE